MRFQLAVAILSFSASPGAAFAPTTAASSLLQRPQTSWGRQNPLLSSTVQETGEAAAPDVVSQDTTTAQNVNGVDLSDGPPSGAGGSIVPLTGPEIKARLDAQLEKLREKDLAAPKLSKEDLDIVYEDDHIVVVNKPCGVLSVSNQNSGPDAPNLAQAVYDAVVVDTPFDRPEKMVVHRLGMDTSGLLAFGKTREAVRGFNTQFRTRKVTKRYEAIVCGRVEKDSGMIHLPIMRDYEFPPFVRISTPDHQRALVGLDPEQVGKQLLELPKESLTKYEVVSREENAFFEGAAEGLDLPVTRVLLTSISGRTHQLNVHMAAFGHAIVGDSFYGYGGSAAQSGGLTEEELETLAPNPSRAPLDLQKRIADAVAASSNSATSSTTRIHAKSLKFQHPVTREEMELHADAPF